jgi:hypothetical protein
MMMSTSTINAVHTNLNYYLELADGGGHTVQHPATAGDKRRKYNVCSTEIEDVRGHESEYELDVHGFAFRREPSDSGLSADGNSEALAKYYAEVVDVLQRA